MGEPQSSPPRPSTRWGGRRSAAWAVLLCLLSLGLSDCGDDANERPQARVVVQQVFRPEGLYGIEGTVSFLVIERDGAPIARRQVVSPGVEEPHTLLDERLEPGSYRVRSYQRACSASCPSSSSDPAHAPSPDPPSARCSAPIEMIADQVVEVLVTVDPAHASCEIDTGLAQTSPNAATHNHHDIALGALPSPLARPTTRP
jgi:hypothetical protein